MSSAAQSATVSADYLIKQTFAILVAYLITIAKILSFEKQHVGVKYLFH